MLDGTRVLSVDSGGLGGAIDLWDTSWPSGGYYWTVIPASIPASTPARDIQLPEDVAVPAALFGSASSASRLSRATRRRTSPASHPRASLRPDQQLCGNLRVPHSSPGRPVYGAQGYQVEWSRRPQAVAAGVGSDHDFGDSNHAAADSRPVALPRARPQPRASGEARDDLVEAGQTPHREASLPHRSALDRLSRTPRALRPRRPGPGRTRRAPPEEIASAQALARRWARFAADGDGLQLLGRSWTSSTSFSRRERSQPARSEASATGPVAFSSRASLIPGRGRPGTGAEVRSASRRCRSTPCSNGSSR